MRTYRVRKTASYGIDLDLKNMWYVLEREISPTIGIDRDLHWETIAYSENPVALEKSASRLALVHDEKKEEIAKLAKYDMPGFVFHRE